MKPTPGPGVLFFDAGTSSAVLVQGAGKRKRRVLRFTDPHAALDYCITRGAQFVYLPAPSSSNN